MLMGGCWEGKGSALVRIAQMLSELGWTMPSRKAEPVAERAAVAAAAAAKAPAAGKERLAGMAMAGGQPPARRKTPPVVSKYFH